MNSEKTDIIQKFTVQINKLEPNPIKITLLKNKTQSLLTILGETVEYLGTLENGKFRHYLRLHSHHPVNTDKTNFYLYASTLLQSLSNGHTFNINLESKISLDPPSLDRLTV